MTILTLTMTIITLTMTIITLTMTIIGTWRTRVLHDENIINAGKYCFDDILNDKRTNIKKKSSRMYFQMRSFSSQTNKTEYIHKTFYSMDECLYFTNNSDGCLLRHDFSWDDHKSVMHRDSYISKWCSYSYHLNDRGNLNISGGMHIINSNVNNMHRNTHKSKLCRSVLPVLIPPTIKKNTFINATYKRF